MEMEILLPLGPVASEHRIPQPPSPPGFGQAGPEFRVRFNPPTLFRAGSAPALFYSRQWETRLARRGPQCSDATAAPSMGPGCSMLPACTRIATPSAPSSANSADGTVKLRAAPLQSPSFTQRRITFA